jgi:predicted transcriptional regulator
MDRHHDHPVFASDDVRPPLTATELIGVRNLLERERRRQLSARRDDPGKVVGEVAFNETELAEQIYRARRDRDRVFKDDIFADPAWDILLDLFVRSARNEPISISSACHGANVPEATALRYLHALTEKKYLERIAHPSDKRSTTLKMTSLGNKLMAEWLQNVRRLG